MLQLGDLGVENAPRESLKSTPAVFDGDRLFAAPLVNLPQDHPLYKARAHVKAIKPHGHVFTSLLSH